MSIKDYYPKKNSPVCLFSPSVNVKINLHIFGAHLVSLSASPVCQASTVCMFFVAGDLSTLMYAKIPSIRIKALPDSFTAQCT